VASRRDEVSDEMQLYPALRQKLDARQSPSDIAQRHCPMCHRLNTWVRDAAADASLIDGCFCDSEGMRKQIIQSADWEPYTPGEPMMCPACGTRLHEDGSCPRCGPSIVGPKSHRHFKCKKCGADVGESTTPTDVHVRVRTSGKCPKCGEPYEREART